MPAKIIEPDTGASTWALGNHKWVKYIGILTIKAKTIKNHQNSLKGKFIMEFFIKPRLKLIEPSLLNMNNSINNKGNEAEIVYIIMYIPASSRSGW